MESGADPTTLDGHGRVAYYLCSNAETRDAFRRFRGRHEEKWDWAAARVPEGLTDEAEERKKEKEREKRKRAKERKKAAAAEYRESEEAKAAAAAAEEARLAAAKKVCSSCGKGIPGTPFVRLEYFYCSTACVQAHRRVLQAEAAEKRFGGETFSSPAR